MKGKYITDSYARIMCTACGNKIVDILQPGKPFNSFKLCECGGEVNEYSNMEIEELRKVLDEKGIRYSPQAKKETLIRKIKES